MNEDLSGTRLRGGEYVLEELLARGGQATVYRAYARALETDVAVKVLDPRFAGDLAFRERFHDEARRLAQLHHQNLLEVHWYGEEGELIYIVMRLVRGGTLLKRFQAFQGPLPMTEAGRALFQIASALQHAHDHDVLHLDVKPGNILLGQADWPLVADLGLTRAIGRETGSADQHSRVAGTPAYMSPEQCRGEDLDGRADQYALAVMAFELLTGQQPFRAETSEELLRAQVHSAPPRPSSVYPGLPGPVEDVLLRALAKNREDRYPRIADFGRDLAEAIDRTRGVSLETKRALAGIAPKLLGILALVLAAPFWLALLPVGTLYGRLPIAWPFQLLLAVAIAVLLLAMRWHLVGLIGRAASHGLHSELWRRKVRASAEGGINLLYLLAIYQLVGGPLLGIARALVDTAVYRLLETVLLLVVGAVGLTIIFRLLRSAGRLPALLLLLFGWGVALVLPATQIDLSGGAQTIASVTQLVVGAGVIVVAVAHRAAVGASVADRALRGLGPVLHDARPGISPEQVVASRQQLARLISVLLDFGYVLLAYALLRGPLLEVLAPISSPIAAAIAISAPALAVWVVLVARLRWIAGLLGVGLGVVLGAPILLSLPLLQTLFAQVSWFETAAAWLTGAAVLVLLAALRGPSQSFGRLAVGARLERGLLGTTVAGTEEQSARRVSAFGRVITAIMDVTFLLAIYWVIGVPVTQALVRATGQPSLSSVVLAGVLLLAVASVVSAARRAAATVAESSGAVWRARARALTALAAAAAALLFTVGAAAPAAVAGPTVVSTGALEPELTRVVDQVVVDWEFWVPWSPRADQATYNLSLSCSNGRPIGQFREAFTPPAGAPMSDGPVGRLGSTSVACDDWQQVYAARRRAAGLPDAQSYSWDWVDVQAILNSDQSVDIIETQRVFFSSGRHSSLSWNLGTSRAGSLDHLEVWEGDSQYAVGAEDVPPPTARRVAQLSQRAGKRALTLAFPEISAPAQRTFVVRYRLTGAVAPDGDHRRFAQAVLDADRLQPVWKSTMEIRLPGHVDATSAQLASTGVAARSGILNEHTAVFDAQDVAAGDGLSVSVTYPSGEATPTPTPTSTSTPEPTDTPTPTATTVPVVVLPPRAPTRVPPTLQPTPSSTPTDSPTDTPTPTEAPTNTPVPVRVVRPPTAIPRPTQPPRRIVIVTAVVPP